MDLITLNEFLNELLCHNIEPDSVRLQNLDREKKLELLLPEDFISLILKHKGSYRSYYSWLLNGDFRANKIRRDAAFLFDLDPEKYIRQTESLCCRLLPSPSSVSARSIKNLLLISFPDKCFHFSEGKQAQIRAHLRYLYARRPARAFAGCILFLLFSPVPSKSVTLADCSRFLLEKSRIDLLFEIKEDVPANIAGDTDAEEQYLYAELLYEKGQHDRALAIYQKLSDQTKDAESFPHLNEVCYRTGQMYAHGDGCKENERRAFYYYEKAVLYGPLGLYELYECRYYGRSCEKQPEQAGNYLKSAADHADYRAIRDLGLAFYSGNEELGIAKDHAAARKYFVSGAGMESENQSDGTCHFMLGKLAELCGNLNEAAVCYEAAARYGHPDARRELLHMHPDAFWNNNKLKHLDAFGKETVSEHTDISRTGTTSINHDTNGICFSTADENLTGMFLTQTGNVYQTFGPAAGDSLLSFLQARMNPSAFHKKLLFYLFSEDPVQNLKDALTVISFFSSFMASSGNKMCEEYAKELTRNVSIRVRCNNRVSELMIDSAIASLEPNYLPMQICNEYLDAANQLLMNAPCFSPVIVVYGSGEEAFWLVKSLIGVCSASGDSFSILVIDSEAENLHRRLQEQCPGIFSHGNLLHLKLFFTSEEKLQENTAFLPLLTSCRYFICASENSAENITRAIQVREQTLRQDPLFENQAMIAAYCPDSQLNWQAGHLSVGDQMPGFDWYNNFNIYMYGSLTQLYSVKASAGNFCEILAWLIHENYSAPIRDEEHRRQVLFQYYSCYYNHDVSRGGGIAFLYHLHALHIDLPEWRDYGTAAGIRILKEKFDSWLSKHSSSGDPQLELVSQREHERWNAFMLTRGWLPASISQMDTYMQKGTLKHHLSIARLHPYIASWEDLGDEDHGIQQAINRIKLRRNPGAVLSDIKELDRENIRMIGKFYGRLLEGNEGI